LLFLAKSVSIGVFHDRNQGNADIINCLDGWGYFLESALDLLFVILKLASKYFLSARHDLQIISESVKQYHPPSTIEQRADIHHDGC
jgi:hypothetical protein